MNVYIVSVSDWKSRDNVAVFADLADAKAYVFNTYGAGLENFSNAVWKKDAAFDMKVWIHRMKVRGWR